MARMIFENDDSSKQIVVTVRELPEETKFDVEFLPTHTTEDFESNHYILFRMLFDSIDRISGGVDITNVDTSGYTVS